MNAKPISKLFPVALITGAAQRIGAEIAQCLHTADYNIVIHYRHSEANASTLASELNAKRENSAICISADLDNIVEINYLAKESIDKWGRVDALVNSASRFFPTIIGETSEQQWNELIGSNMKAPFFLAQALKQSLAAQNGTIINIADIYAEKPLANHTVYCMAKAGNVMLTKSLATEMAPLVRVNGIAPGAILWPENGGAMDKESQQKILKKVPLSRAGSAKDIADTVLFLLRDSPYITGQIIAVDGGRSLHI
jgi:pteridine reductase